MFKKICVYIFFFFLQMPNSFAQSQYQLSQSHISSGVSITNSQENQKTYQEVGQMISGYVSEDNYKLVNGYHMSSHVDSISGPLAYDKEIVSLNSTISSFIHSHIQYQAKSQELNAGVVYQFSNGITYNLDDYSIYWDSINDSVSSLKNQDDILLFRARVFDGLTYGPWFETSSYVVDNFPPQIQNIDFLTPLIFSPSNPSSVGVQDFVDVQLEAGDKYLNIFKLDIHSSQGNFVNQFDFLENEDNISDQFDLYSFRWDGVDSQDQVTDSGIYEYQIRLSDLAGNITNVSREVFLDDESPVMDFVTLISTGKAFNSQLVDLNLNWNFNDNFAQSYPLSYFSTYSFNDFEPKNVIDNLVLWLDSSDANTFVLDQNNRIMNWRDKSNKRNDFIQDNIVFSPVFEKISDSSIPVVRFDLLAGGLSSTHKFDFDLFDYYYYTSIYNGSSWAFFSGQLDLISSGQSLIGFGNLFPLNVFDLISVDSSLSMIYIADFMVLQMAKGSENTPDQSLIMDYFSFKLGLNQNQDQLFTNCTDESCMEMDVKDSIFYRSKIVVTDGAGNTLTTFSEPVRAVDRTAPNFHTSFVITGNEDVSFRFDPSPFEFDNQSYVDGISVEGDILYRNDVGVAASEFTLNFINETITQQYLDFGLKQHANTDSNLNGNQFGLALGSQPAVRLKLTDLEGNFSYQYIPIEIQAVNDLPVIDFSKISTALPKNQLNSYFYHFRMLEDHTSSPFELDQIVYDVDNLVSDFTWDIIQEGYAPVAESLGISYESQYLSVFIGDENTNHQILFTPSENYYGDTSFTIQVNDSSGGVITDNILVRVWPVNDAPLISDSLEPIRINDEDNSILLSLGTYENDVLFEDEVPTYGYLLNWSIENYDSSLITVYDHNSDTSLKEDQLLIVPKKDFYGEVPVTLTLTDTDSTAESVFPDTGLYGETYIADPKSTKVDFTLNWRPVNDVPVIAFIPTQSLLEDFDVFSFDLSPFKSDIEDENDDLVWQVQYDEQLLTFNYNSLLNTIDFTSVLNVWGNTTVTLQLYDKDQNIDYPNYLPDPKYSQRSFVLSIDSVNDAPSLNSITVLSDRAHSSSRTLTNDTIEVSALGYTDVGYLNGQRELIDEGDEYNASLDGQNSFSLNQELYSYIWYVNGVEKKRNLYTNLSRDTFQVLPEYEGQPIQVEVYPYDGYDRGQLLSKTLHVNTLPTSVHENLSAIYPQIDAFSNTENMTIAWQSSTDLDGDEVFYQLKVFEVPSYSNPPNDTSFNSTYFFQSPQWEMSDSDVMSTTVDRLSHNRYYWKVFVANKFGNEYDFKEDQWLGYFNIDTIAPSIENFDSIFGFEVFSAYDNFYPVYGDKPVDISEGIDASKMYQIVFSSIHTFLDPVSNEIQTITSSGILVDFTEQEKWAAYLEIPEYGIITYNLFIQDQVPNQTFITPSIVFGNDTSPPSDILINGQHLSSYDAVTSQSYYVISGIKEANSAIFYEGMKDGALDSSQWVGNTELEVFTSFIYPEKPSGNLVAIDADGNVNTSFQPFIDIEFLIGSPEITILQKSRSIVNAKENTYKLQSLNLSSSQIYDLTHIDLTFSVNRNIQYYVLMTNNDHVIVSGNQKSSGELITINLEASKQFLNENLNNLVLRVVDDANNEGQALIPVTLKSEPPNVFVLNQNEIVQNDNGYWTVFLSGSSLVGVSVNVNNSFQDITYSSYIYNDLEINSNRAWSYQNSTFDPANESLNVYFIDEVYNVGYLQLWDHITYDGISLVSLEPQDLTDSVLNISYSSLPDGIQSVFVERMNDSQSSFSSTISGKSLDSDSSSNFIFPESLKNRTYKLLAKNQNGLVMEDINLTGHDVYIDIPYPLANDFDPTDLIVLKYDLFQEKWEKNNLSHKLNRSQKIVSAKVNSTGTFALADENRSWKTLDQLQVYPNPWIPEDGNPLTGVLAGGVTFDNLANQSEIKIYNILGELVFNHTSADEELIVWNCQSQNGQDVYSGVYLYVVKDSQSVKKGKITIVR